MTWSMRIGASVPGHRLELVLDRLAHHQLEDGQQRLPGQRTEAVERLADLSPLLRRLAGFLERLPDVRLEQVDVGACDGGRVVAQHRADLERVLERDAELAEYLRRALEARARHLPLVVADLPDEAELDRALRQLRCQLVAPALQEDLRRDALRLLGLDRLCDQRVGELQRVAERFVGRALDQVADRLEAEAAVHELADESQPGEVLGAVEALAPAQLGLGEETALAVGADVAGGHTGLACQVVDREVGVSLGHGIDSRAGCSHVTQAGAAGDGLGSALLDARSPACPPKRPTRSSSSMASG